MDTNGMTTPIVHQDLAAELAALRAENTRLKERAAKAAMSRLSLKIGEKGGLSLYGMGRFPVTLYREQWERLIAYIPVIQDYIADHADQLKAKGE